MRPPSPLKRVNRDLQSPGLSSPSPTGTRSPMPSQMRTLRRPMSMAALPNGRDRVSLSRTSMVSLQPPSQQQHQPSPSPTNMYRGTIRVSVRSKPEAEYSPQWSVYKPANSISHASAGEFTFDNVFDKDSSNGEVFHSAVGDLLDRVCDGFNATVFAYGMTGSGKTFSMQGTQNDPGIIPRSAQLLFKKLEAKPHASTVRISYLEIYNERVADLLHPDTPEVTLRDDPVYGVREIGLSEHKVANANELLEKVALGDQLRRTSSTQFNERSSRSHAVVKVTVLTQDTQSMLYMCDLAGSERAVSQVERRKEGAYINKSLLTLGTVISRLSLGGTGHVPYRDSKLTRLLQPSLSGSALVSILCTVQTVNSTATETLNTLRFAARAKNIIVQARRTGLTEDGPGNERLQHVIEQQRLEIAQLKLDLEEARSARDDSQGCLEAYLNLNDDQFDDSLESILSIPEMHTLEDYRRQARADKREIQQLNEQIRNLISQVAEANNMLENMPHLEHAIPAPRYSVLTANPDIMDLQDEIRELKETIRDKDHIIKYLRGSSERRAQLDKITSPSRTGRQSISLHAPQGY